MLHLLQLLVEHGDGFGPFGDLLDFVFDGDGISHDGDGVLRSGQRRESDEEKEEEKEFGFHRSGWVEGLLFDPNRFRVRDGGDTVGGLAGDGDREIGHLWLAGAFGCFWRF